MEIKYEHKQSMRDYFIWRGKKEGKQVKVRTLSRGREREREREREPS